MTPKKIQIIDTTIPKGGFQINHSFLPEQVVEIAQGLERANIKFMEVSHGCGVGSFKQGLGGLHSEKVYLKALAKASIKLNYSLFFSIDHSPSLEIESLKDLFQVGRVGLYYSEIPKAKAIFQKLKDHNKTSMAILKGIGQIHPQQLTEAAENFKAWGVETIFLEDTFGDITEETFRSTLETSQIDKILPFGFTTSQNLGMGLQLARQAATHGATWLDGALMGFGQGGGTLPLEILTHLLKKGGWCEEIDLVELSRTAKNYALPAIRTLPHPSGLNFLMSRHQLEYYPVQHLSQLAELLEIPLEDFLKELKNEAPDLHQLNHEILESYLVKHQLDLNVVKKFFETGKIPKS